jgi:hypothetical protein
MPRGHPIAARALPAATVAALTAVFAVVGADSRWLAALGRTITSTHGIPDGVPYAAAASAGWPNATALGQVIFGALDAAGGVRGLLLAQVVAVAAAAAALTVQMSRDGARPRSWVPVVLLVWIGAFPAFVVVRAQLFSLVLFPLLALLLRSEARTPSRRIWLLVPLLALWANLHGGVLVGLAVALAYLVVARARARPAETSAVAVACVASLCATPAGLRTPEYFHGVLSNAAADRGVGLWAALSPHSGIDLLLMAAACALLVLAARGGVSAWELAAFAGLAVMTVHAARSGVWLLLLAAPAAARAFRKPRAHELRLAAPLLATAVVWTAVGLVRGPLVADAGTATLARALAEARGTPIMAADALGEQVALAGGRVWIANPIDAFRPADQSAYIEWLDGHPAGDAVLANARRVVLVDAGSPPDLRLRRRRDFRVAARDRHAVVYIRRAAPTPLVATTSAATASLAVSRPTNG